MKIFDKKEEKNKVGRPKLADMDTKKKSIIMCAISSLLVIMLLAGGLVSLNILPNFNRLKGTANTSLCTEIPARFQPRSETNAEGLHEYGFTDPKFYSAVLSGGRANNSYPYNNPTYCSTITEEELASITDLNASSSDFTNADGVQYLTGLTNLELSNNKLSSIDVSNNTALRYLFLSNNNLSSIDVSHNTGLYSLYLEDNNLSSIDVSYNASLQFLNLSNNNLSSIDVSYNASLQFLNLSNNNLSSIDVSKNTALTSVYLSGNKFEKIYYSNKDNILIDQPDVKTAYPNDTIYSITDTSVASYENGVVKKVSLGSATLKITYKVSPSITFNIDYTINFININLTSSYYTIDNENKTIDVKGEMLSNVYDWKFNINPSNFQKTINGDKLEIKDNNGNLIDTYQIINAKVEDENAYTKAGFKDKNLYTCVVRSYYGNEDISGNYLLTDEELEEVDYLECYNVEIKDATGLEKLTNLSDLYLYNNNLSGTIDVSKLEKLGVLQLANNNINNMKLPITINLLLLSNNKLSGTLDLSKYENLEGVYLDNNKLDKVILPNNPNFYAALLHGNNLKSIDLSNYPNLEAITLQDNLLSTIYMLKNATMKYSDIFKINSSIEVEYEIEDENVATYNNDTIKALKEGITTLKLYNENMYGMNLEFADKCLYEPDYDNNREYCDNVSEEEVMLPYFMSNEIKVYDIKSDAYKIDKDKKTIDVKGTNLDVSKVKLTLDGLKGIIEGNYYVIKDGNREVDKYKILNPKVDKEETTTTTITTTKKEIANTTKSKTTTKSNTTTTKENKDIELSTSIVPSILLQSIKGQDRNIVVTKDNITFTINGKDIENINGNIDLSVEIEDIEKTILKEELKEKVEKAVVLNFKNESELPGKVLVEVKETEEIKKTIGTKDINVYNYNKDKYNLVAENLSLNNNKITFYVDKLGYYVLTNEKVEDKYVEVDDSMMGENTKLNKEIRYKKIIIPIVIIVILITLGIVGYVRYKKNIKRHK